MGEWGAAELRGRGAGLAATLSHLIHIFFFLDHRPGEISTSVPAGGKSSSCRHAWNVCDSIET